MKDKSEGNKKGFKNIIGKNVISIKGKIHPVAIPEEENDEGKKPAKKRIKINVSKGFIATVAILLVLFGVLMYLSSDKSDYKGYEVVAETSVVDASVIDYVAYQKSLLKYSKDGATYVDEKGEAVWNESYAMKKPRADVCGDYVAIADMNGNDVYIFDKEGKVSSKTMPYGICDISVASQGEYAVILKSEKENYINIYDKNGEVISERKTTIDKSGYPMDIDLSFDGKKLFSSYLNLSGGKAGNSLAAYNFGSVGQNENADRLMGGYQLDDCIAPKVEFLDNNTICAFADNKFLIYSMREKPSEKAVIEMDKEIKSVVYNEDYIGVVFENEEDDAAEYPYILELYNTGGRRTMSKKLDFSYSNVRMIGGEIIFTGGMECHIYETNGSLKFRYTFAKNVTNVVPTGSRLKYIVLYDSGSEIIKLKKRDEQKSE